MGSLSKGGRLVYTVCTVCELWTALLLHLSSVLSADALFSRRLETGVACRTIILHSLLLHEQYDILWEEEESLGVSWQLRILCWMMLSCLLSGSKPFVKVCPTSACQLAIVPQI